MGLEQVAAVLMILTGLLGPFFREGKGTQSHDLMASSKRAMGS